MSKNSARPKINRQHRTHPSTRSAPGENRASDLHDDIKEFEEFRETTLKAIRKDIAKGVKPKELREKYASIVQGRLITTMLTSEDEKTVAAIGKDIIDRAEGRATEKKEVTHKFAELKDEEIDALLKSEIEDLEDMEARFEQ